MHFGEDEVEILVHPSTPALLYLRLNTKAAHLTKREATHVLDALKAEIEKMEG